MSSSVDADESERPPCRVSRLARPLVLVQQRDGVDQRQILLVVAPRPGPLRRERQLVGVGIHHGQRLQAAAARCAAARSRSLPLLLQPQAFERPGLALQARGCARSAPGSRPPSAIRHRFCSSSSISIGRRRQEDHHRPFDVVFLRLHAARLRVLAGAGDGQFAFATAGASRRSWPSPRPPPRRWRGSCVSGSVSPR